jgi:hypothetical protein
LRLWLASLIIDGLVASFEPDRDLRGPNHLQGQRNVWTMGRVGISPDGAYLVAGLVKGGVCLWKLADNTLQATRGPH